ncbi:OmpH family outer membrane protein [Cerasicoccus frondis]|uniref:OmpH family outer membrane protein n=1 Tax=Cerasicoccus frondis TaxID=490090 RepID=UPI002852C80B|nr:OmpH family outer membrane protein [Cerasicoccus frondis]
MRKILITLLAFGAMSVAFAQNSPVILTVNVAKLYDGYWKAKEAEAKFQSSIENAQQEIQTMISEGMQMTESLQELQAESSSPAISDERKKEIAAEAQEKIKTIQQKERDVNQFRQTTDRQLQQRRQAITELHLSDIQAVVTEVAKSKGADLVLNTQGLAVVYSSEAMDITDDVMTKLNADKP